MRGRKLPTSVTGRRMCRLRPPQPASPKLLVAWREGDEAALARLTLLVHQELQRMAQALYARGTGRPQSPGHGAGEEAYLRLFDVQHVNWRDRSHFMAMAARMMRRILVEFARAKIREKRGGGWVKVSLGEDLVTTRERPGPGCTG